MATGRLNIEVRLDDQASAGFEQLKQTLEQDTIRAPVEPVVQDVDEVRQDLSRELGSVQTAIEIEIEIEGAQSQINTLRGDLAQAARVGVELDVAGTASEIDRIETDLRQALSGSVEVDISDALSDIDRIERELDRALQGRIRTTGGGFAGGGLGAEDANVPNVGDALEAIPGVGFAVGTLGGLGAGAHLLGTESAAVNASRARFDAAISRTGADRSVAERAVEGLAAAGFPLADSYETVTRFMQRTPDDTVLAGIPQLARYLRANLYAATGYAGENEEVLQLLQEAADEPEQGGAALIPFLGLSAEFLDTESAEATFNVLRGAEADAPLSFIQQQRELSQLLLGQLTYLSQTERAITEITARDEQAYIVLLDSLASRLNLSIEEVARSIGEEGYDAFIRENFGEQNVHGILQGEASTLRAQAAQARRLQEQGVGGRDALLSLRRTDLTEDLFAPGRRALAELNEAEVLEATHTRALESIQTQFDTVERVFEELAADPSVLQPDFDAVLEKGAETVLEPINEQIEQTTQALAQADAGTAQHAALQSYLNELLDLRDSYNESTAAVVDAQDELAAADTLLEGLLSAGQTDINAEIDRIAREEAERDEGSPLSGLTTQQRRTLIAQRLAAAADIEDDPLLTRLYEGFRDSPTLQNYSAVGLDRILRGGGIGETAFGLANQYAATEIGRFAGEAFGQVLGGPVGNVIGQHIGGFIANSLTGNLDSVKATFESFTDGLNSVAQAFGLGSGYTFDPEDYRAASRVRRTFEVGEEFGALGFLELIEALGVTIPSGIRRSIEQRNPNIPVASTPGDTVIIQLGNLQEGSTDEREQRLIEYINDTIIPLLVNEFGLSREVITDRAGQGGYGGGGRG